MARIIIDGFYLNSGRGIGNYIQNLLNQISGFLPPNTQIHVIYKSGSIAQDYDSANINYVKIPYVPFPIWEFFVIPIISFLLRANIVHFPANSSSPLPIHGKRIVTIHDTIFMHSPKLVPQSPVFRQRIGRLYLAWNLRFNARRYDEILTVSQCSKNDIINLTNVDPQKICVTSEGPGQHFTSSQKPIAMRRSILHFASEDPRKNTKRAIDAFLKSSAPSKGYTLELIGGQGLSKILNTGYSPFIRSHPPLSSNNLQSILDETALLLYPSLYEGFGMPIIEFQAVGIPVITSNKSSCAEIGAQGSILITPEDTMQISNSIDLVISNIDVALRMQKDGILNSQKFSWEKTAKLTLEAYLEA